MTAHVRVRASTGVAVLALGGLAWVTAARVPHPFPLEWQEGAMVEHARRLTLGLPLYMEPGLDFAPFPYPPLFHVCAAGALGTVGGAEAGLGAALVAARGVSVLATVALLGLVALAARDPRGVGRCDAAGGLGPARASGTLAAGLVAAGAGFGGWFLDLARVDALALALTVAALLAARAARTRAAAALAALVAVAAVATKQTSLAPCVCLAVPLASRSLRLGLVYSAVLAVALGGLVAWGDAVTDGWASFTILDLLAGSPWHAPGARGFAAEVALAYAPAFALVAHFRRHVGAALRAAPFDGAAAIGLAVAAFVGRAHEGGHDNTLLPWVVAAALVVPRLAARSAARGADALAAASLAWLAVAGGDPRAVVPTAADVEATQRAVTALAALPAPAFVPDAPDLAERAGHGPAVHAMAIVDLLKSGEDDVARGFVARLEAALDAGLYGAVVLDAPWSDLPALERGYRLAATVDVPPPRTGAPRVPRLVYVRR